MAAWTLLHAAAANGQAGMLDVLVRKGLSPCVLNAKGELPLAVAPERSPCAKRLLELSAEEAVRCDNVSLLAVCLARGVDLAAVGAFGESIAAAADKCGHPAVLGFLAQRRLNARPDAFRTALLLLTATALLFASRR